MIKTILLYSSLDLFTFLRGINLIFSNTSWMFYFQKMSSDKIDSVSPGIESQVFLIKFQVATLL